MSQAHPKSSSEWCPHQLAYHIKDFEFQDISDEIQRIKEQDITRNTSDYEVWKVKFEEEHFIMTGNKTKVIRMKKNGTPDIFDKPNDFLNDCKINNNYLKDLDFIEKWLFEDDGKKAYDRFDFIPPPLQCPVDVYNTWSDFKYEGIEYQLTEEESQNVWSDFQEYFNHLCGNNEELSNYLLNLTASRIQVPGIKTGVCLFMFGEQGGGKGTYFRLLDRLLGNYFVSSGKINDVVGEFNSLISKRLVINIDEAVTKDIYQSSSTLKNLITEPTVSIRKMRTDPYTESSYCTVIISNNNDNLPIEPSDRRYLTVKANKIKKDLLDKINSIIDDENKLCFIFHKLKEIEIPYKNMYDWQTNRVKTEIYEEIKMMNLPTHIKWANRMIDNEISFRDEEDKDIENNEEKEFTVSDLFEMYKEFLKSDGFSLDKIGYQKFCKSINPIFGDSVDRKRSGRTVKCKVFTIKNVVQYLEENGLRMVNYE